SGDRPEEQPCADALIFEPMPFRSAVAEGCTHVLVLRTRPDGRQVLGKSAGLYERRIARQFFDRFHRLPHVSEHMLQQRHLQTYAEDILLLAESASTGEPVAMPPGGAGTGRSAHLLAIAPSPDCTEVNQLETSQGAILQGCRDGFAACWDALAPLAGRGGLTGVAAAREYFPDSCLGAVADLTAT
ncbi:unnamed protein product, partial [Phaeothamnion confervicola]